MLDWRPDLPEDTPGLLTSVTNLYPSTRGYVSATKAEPQTAHELVLDPGTPTYEAAVSSLFATRWLTTAGGIVIAGTDRNLYVYDWTNGFIKVSKSGGYSLYSGVTYQYGEDSTAAFDHCAFGDILIATNRAVVPQYRTALIRTNAAVYADLGTPVLAPKAACCAVASNFVFLGDLNSTWGTTTSVVGSRDMVAWCGIGNHQSWDVNAPVTQASFAQFVDTPGAITALAPWQDGIIVFKANAMYRGHYVGAGPNSSIWDFERVSDRIGCLGPKSWVDIGNRLVFVGPEDIYSFDGTRPVPITDGIWETEIRGQTNSNGIYPMTIGHDKPRNLILLRRGQYPTQDLVWSYRYNRWSVLTSEILGEDYIVGRHVFCRTNIGDFRKVTPTITGGGVEDDHINLYSMFAVVTASTNAGGFQVAAKCRCYNRFDNTGAYPANMSLTTGAFGSDDKITAVDRVSPKWAQAPTTATAQMDRKDSLGASWKLGASTAMGSRKRFDVLGTTGASAPWHRATISVTDPFEIIDINVGRTPAGAK
jgi:hypothetical protein